MEEREYVHKLEPFSHQLQSWRRTRDDEIAALFPEMGTGKTKIVIDTAAWLYLNGQIDSMLVIAPKGLYYIWQDEEIPLHFPDQVPYEVVTWESSARVAAKRRQAEFVASKVKGKLSILVMNVEALVSKRAEKYAHEFLTGRHTMIVIDESTCVKNPRAKTTRACMRLGKRVRYRRIMSGDPAANSPLDLFSQTNFLEPGILGYTTFTAFRADFANVVMIPNPRAKGYMKEFPKVVGYKNLDVLTKKLEKFSVIIKQKDCLDLPPKQYLTRTFDISKEQRAAYKDLTQNALAVIDSQVASGEGNAKVENEIKQDILGTVGDTAILEQLLEDVKAGRSQHFVLAQLVITQMIRQQQIACGFAVDEDGTVLKFKDQPRLDMLLAVLSEIGSEQAVIWAPFRPAIAMVADKLREKGDADRVVEYHGGVTQEDRRTNKKKFQDGEADWFIGNPQTARFGLTLTAARYAIYYANSWKPEHRTQSEDRIYRISQTRSVIIVDIVARDTQDVRIVRALRNKKKLSQMVTPSNWKAMLRGEIS